MNWNYMQPVKISFGAGVIKSLPNIINNCVGESNNGMLVCSKTFVKNGTADEIIKMCAGRIEGVFSDISANPDTSETDLCAEKIRQSGAKFIVALGGGSVLDCAKAAASVALTDDSIVKYHGTGVQLSKEHLPLIAVPTTSGTGSEVTCVSVLTNRETGKKAPIASDNFYPDYAVVDPELTYSVPKMITANTGMDVLCHAIEGFWSKGHQPICDALAVHATQLVFENLETIYQNPEDKIGREKLSQASVIAGLAFSLPKTTSSHACSFPLTNIYSIPHGEACALTIDYFARINGKSDDGRLADFAKKLGFDCVEKMSDRIFEMKKNMNMRTDLKEFNLTDSQIDDLVKISRHPNLLNNPVEITDEMLYEMYNHMK